MATISYNSNNAEVIFSNQRTLNTQPARLDLKLNINV